MQYMFLNNLASSASPSQNVTFDWELKVTFLGGGECNI